MKRDVIRFIMTLVTIIVFSLTIYPTPYKYKTLGDNRYLLKTNWVTGNSWHFDHIKGWIRLENDPSINE